MRKKKNLVALIGVGVLLSGCAGKTDLDKLEGEWKAENQSIIFYAPNEDGDTFGDAEITKYDDKSNATYEWHESSQRIIVSYADNWGDIVSVTFKYEIVEDTELNLTPIGFSDSTRTVSYDDEETMVFIKEE